MNTTTHTRKRSFEIRNISEEEGRILRTLLNLNESGIRKKLQGDEGYWDEYLTEEEAVEVGIQVREQIFEMVDKQR